MALPQPRFICYTAQKVVVFDDREEVLKEQRSKLESYVKNEPGESVVLSGGCLNAVGDLLGQGHGFVAAFIGTLDNFGSLSKQLSNENWSSNSSGQSKNAELVCHLYKIFGRVLPQKMRGSFSFVLYDAAQGRVLAAASHTSKTHLLQARGPDGCLIVTSLDAADLPHGCHLLTHISPGYSKYGWSSDPQPFANPVASPELRGIKTKTSMPRAGNLTLDSETPRMVQRSSLSFADSEAATEDLKTESGAEPPSPATKKTRRGKRAGKNQKLRAELMSRLSTELRRNSCDSRTSLEPPSPTMGSFSGRADGRNWWRTDTPRSSFEVRVGSMPSGSGLMSARPSFGISRSSMSAAATPFVPASMIAPRPNQLSPAQGLSGADGSASAGGRTEPPEGSLSRVVLTTSMSGSLGNPSPFAVPTKTSQSGKADAAWEDGSNLAPHPSGPRKSGTMVGPACCDNLPSHNVAHDGIESQLSLALAAQNEAASSEYPAGKAPAVPFASSAEQGSTDQGVMDKAKPISAECQSDSKANAGVMRNDSACEDGSCESARIVPKTKASIREFLSRDSGSSTGRSTRSSVRFEQSEDDRHPRGASPPRGGSPSRPPKPPGAKFKHMFKAMMHRRPSHVDLTAEIQKDRSKMESLKASSSHGALADLEAHTGFWDAPRPHTPTLSHNTSRNSLSSQPSAEKVKLSSSKSSHLGSHSNLAWLARQTRNIFSKSKSCEDLRAIGDSPQPPNVTAGGN